MKNWSEQQHIDDAYSMLQGCMNRICVTDDISEIIRLKKSADYHLARLYKHNLQRINSLSDEQ